MSKPPFKMPQRATTPAGELDQWVSGGEKGQTAAAPPRTAEKPARLTIDLPAELHAKFKARCALKRTRMIDEVRRFIEDWTQKNG
jgi:hypothetical protein